MPQGLGYKADCMYAPVRGIMTSSLRYMYHVQCPGCEQLVFYLLYIFIFFTRFSRTEVMDWFVQLLSQIQWTAHATYMLIKVVQIFQVSLRFEVENTQIEYK